MGTRPTKAIGNVYCDARLEAAKYNDRLKSREGAAELLGYASSSTITDWELGVKIPTPDAVLKMADLYNAPELINKYCTEQCPLGGNVPKVDMESLDRITVKTLSTFRKLSETKEKLLDITEDGIISDDEKNDMRSIIKHMEEIEKVAVSLKMWAEKNL